MKNSKNKSKISDAFNTMNEAEAASYGTRVWFGAIFIYLIKFGKVPFSVVYSKKNQRRNVIIGYLLVIILIPLGILLLSYIFK
jgi:predicted neutral ceramidase superfamily lipid hydrolase